MSTTPLKTYVDTNQLAAQTGIAASTWEKRRLSGDTPPYLKIGKRVLYDLETAHKWLAAHVRTSTSDQGGAA